MVTAGDDFPEDGYRALVQAAPDGVLVVDSEGRILLANPEVRRMTGFEPSELIGETIETLVPDEFRGRHVGHRDGYAQNPHARPMGSNLELWAVRKDGSRLAVEIMLAPMMIAGRRVTIAFVRDATDRRRRQRELEEANATAYAAIRELEAFSYSVAHDLRAPLRSIDGFSQAVLEDYADRLDDDGRDYLARVRAAAQRMGHLIDDLLALSQVGRAPLARTHVDVSAVARAVGESLQQGAPGRDVELRIEPGIELDADAGLMRIVLENLLGNAWKFTSKKAHATIEVGRAEGGFYVKDDGAGFDMGARARLFGAFQRLHTAAEFEGSGIGLATVQRIIVRHGGQLSAVGEPGKGATFTVWLPAEGRGQRAEG